jgi:DNA-binding XRE family transcriptional regulator
MKTKPNLAVKALRTIIGRTQDEFAAMIGATRDAVASWEGGRNHVSDTFAQRIFMSTGAFPEDLVKGVGIPRFFLTNGRPYSKGDFDWYRSERTETHTESAIRHAKNGASALEVLLLAAAKPGFGRIKDRLPAVWNSFIDWCDQTREDFKLEKQIDGVLSQRKFKDRMTGSWGEWRRLKCLAARSEAAEWIVSCYNFKDDKRKLDDEELTLEVETCPDWEPGIGMVGKDRALNLKDFAAESFEPDPPRSSRPAKPAAKPAKRKPSRR